MIVNAKLSPGLFSGSRRVLIFSNGGGGEINITDGSSEEIGE